MNKILKMTKLDILSIRPYLTMKNFIIFFALGVFYSIISKNPYITVAMFSIGALLYSTYPFLVGDEAGIDSLYKIFGFSAKDVVKGRFLTGTFIIVALTLIGVLFSVIAATFMKVSIDWLMILTAIPTTIMITTLIMSLEYPLFFKLGYTKGKLIASFPYLLVTIVVIGISLFPDIVKPIFGFFSKHQAILFVALAAVWLAVIIGSILLSVRWYRRREF